MSPLFLYIGRIFPFSRLSSIIDVSNTTLNNLTKIGSIRGSKVFICALWSPAWKGLTSWLSFVVSYCEFVTFLLVSWAGCGT